MSTGYAFDHVGLSVADLDAMVAWDERTFGFTVELSFVLEAVGIKAAMLRARDGTRLELLERAGSAPHEPADPLAAMLVRSYGHWAFAVDDIERAFAELVDAGARPVWTPRAAPAPAPGAMAYLADPEGNLIELVARGAVAEGLT